MKRLWSLLLVLLLIPCLVTAASAEETSGKCGENVYWAYEEATGTLTISGSGDMDEYRWLHTGSSSKRIDKEPWYSIRTQIRTVVIGEGVTGIGSYAFSGCSKLTSVTISDTVTKISWYAFYDSNALETIVLPDSVTSMEPYVFYSCDSLKKITLPNKLKTVPKGFCEQCKALTSIKIPGSVEVIGDGAFQECGLKTATLGKRVREIGWDAFGGNSRLTRISLPASLKKIGLSAFYECRALETVTYSGSKADRDDIFFDQFNGELIAARWECEDGVLEGTYEAPYIGWSSTKAASGKPVMNWNDTYSPEDQEYTVNSFRIYRSEKERSGFKLLKTCTKKSSAFTDTTAVAGKTYYYKVKALDKETGETSGYSNTVKITCRLKAPKFTVDENDDTGITEVKWETVEGAVKYRVYRTDDYYGTYTHVYTGINARIYRDTDAKVGKTYYYKVKAVHKNTEANSLTLGGRSGRRKLPTPPIQVSLTKDGDPKVTWETVKGAVKYEVYRCTTEHGTYELVKTAVKSRTFVDKEAKSGKRYYYTVRVQDKTGGYSECAWAKSVRAK